MTSNSQHGITRMNLINILISSIFFLLLQLPAIALAESDNACQITDSDLSAASDTVSKLHNALMTVMQDAEKLGYPGRYEILAPVIAENFNTPLIVKTILSRYWDNLSEQQRHEFTSLFQHLSIATYADRFDSFDADKFVELERKALPLRGRCPPPPGRDAPAQRILIKTELQRANDDNVKLDYLLQKIDGKWYIITVIADGVNDLSLKRGEYSDVIRNSGFDGLVEELKTKIKNMENGAE